MFIGGIGVLGNVLRHSDDSSVGTFREIHDLDVVLRSRPYGYIADAFFDSLDTKKSSLSIPGKLVFQGFCFDINGEQIPETWMDLYVPNGNSRRGATVNGVNFDYYQWESRKTANLFGIPFNVANPLTLLYLKLDITTGKKSLRRIKDCQDIVNLMGVLERDSCPPVEVYNGLTVPQRSKLKEVFSENCQLCEGCGIRDCRQLIKPSESYIKEIFKYKEENKPQDNHENTSTE